MIFASFTHTGYVRELNEDSVYVPARNQIGPLASFIAVADGMGGHRAGEIASSIAIRSMANYFLSDTAQERVNSDPASFMSEAIFEANNKIYLLSKTKGPLQGMGTTITAAYVTPQRICIGHIGDSRAYLYRNDGTFMRLTRDHSWVQELVNKRLLTEEQAIHHPQRNVLSKALGISPDENADIHLIDWVSGDKLLLCSDGLCGYVSDSDIKLCLLHEQTMEECAWALGELALSVGGYDNVSVCLACNEKER